MGLHRLRRFHMFGSDAHDFIVNVLFQLFQIIRAAIKQTDAHGYRTNVEVFHFGHSDGF